MLDQPNDTESESELESELESESESEAELETETETKETPQEIAPVQADSVVVIQHLSYPEWGRGVMIWEKPTKRGYVFEDGQIRLFKKGFYHFLEAQQLETSEAEQIVRGLERTASRRGMQLSQTEEKKRAAKARKSSASQIGLADQIRFFHHEYPEGFEDASWVSTVRRRERPVKRHREPVCEKATAKLSAEALAELEPEAVLEQWLEIMETSDLLTRKQLDSLSAMGEQGQRTVGHALRELLYGEDSPNIRLERWINALHRSLGTPTWSLTTVPLAITQPEEHAYVRRSVVVRLTRLRGYALPKRPSAPAYQRTLEVLKELSTELTDQDEKPRDYFDVYDFVRVTLRPKAQAFMEGGG